MIYAEYFVGSTHHPVKSSTSICCIFMGQLRRFYMLIVFLKNIFTIFDLFCISYYATFREFSWKLLKRSGGLLKALKETSISFISKKHFISNSFVKLCCENHFKNMNSIVTRPPELMNTNAEASVFYLFSLALSRSKQLQFSCTGNRVHVCVSVAFFGVLIVEPTTQ